MLRRPAAAPIRALAIQRRFASSTFGGNLLGHLTTSPEAYVAVGALTSTPLGTGAMVLLSYNTCVVGLKHLWYTLEFVARDYVQDLVLAQTLRYMILITLMLCAAQLFVEA